MLREEPGWVGVFTRHQAKGAIPNGTKIQKIVREPGDAHQVGSIGTVLGSVLIAEVGLDGEIAFNGRTVQYIYFIEWQDRPRLACGTTDFKIAPINRYLS